MGRYQDRSKNMWHMMADSVALAVTGGLDWTLSWVSKRCGDQQADRLVKDLFQQQRTALDRRVRGYLNDEFQDVRLLLSSALLSLLVDVIVCQSHDC